MRWIHQYFWPSSYSYNSNHGPSLLCLHFARALRERPLASVCPWLMQCKRNLDFKIPLKVDAYRMLSLG